MTNVIQKEIRNKKDDIDRVVNDIKTLVDNLKQTVNEELIISFTQKIYENKLQEMIIVKSKHKRKLNTLCNSILPLKECNDKFIRL